jgi:soluble lytic murein transglycosylase-like protein
MNETRKNVFAAALSAVVALVVLSGSAAAETNPAEPSSGTSPVTWECLMDVAERFKTPPALILAVLAVEGGRVGRSVPDAVGGRDLGPMQINALWLPRLAELGLTEAEVRDHGCLNLAVGAWILRSRLKGTDGPLAAATAYHSRDPERGRRYLAALLERAGRLDVDETLARANGTVFAASARRARGRRSEKLKPLASTSVAAGADFEKISRLETSAVAESETAEKGRKGERGAKIEILKKDEKVSLGEKAGEGGRR